MLMYFKDSVTTSRHFLRNKNFLIYKKYVILFIFFFKCCGSQPPPLLDKFNSFQNKFWPQCQTLDEKTSEEENSFDIENMGKSCPFNNTYLLYVIGSIEIKIIDFHGNIIYMLNNIYCEKILWDIILIQKYPCYICYICICS